MVLSAPGSDLQRIIDSTPALMHTARPGGYHDSFNETWLLRPNCLSDFRQLVKSRALRHWLNLLF
jgi:hypothetical protein